MPTGVVHEDSMVTTEFTDTYNKWLQELINIENKLLSKAKDIQQLQNSLFQEAEILKCLHDTLTPKQIEQNYLEELLNAFLVEQGELEREIGKLEETEHAFVDVNSEECEECTVTFESVETELTSIKETIRSTVGQLNNDTNKIDKTKNPFDMYRTVLDHYADALQLMNENSVEIREKLDRLNALRLQYFIPSSAFNASGS